MNYRQMKAAFLSAALVDPMTGAWSKTYSEIFGATRTRGGFFALYPLRASEMWSSRKVQSMNITIPAILQDRCTMTVASGQSDRCIVCLDDIDKDSPRADCTDTGSHAPFTICLDCMLFLLSANTVSHPKCLSNLVDIPAVVNGKKRADMLLAKDRSAFRKLRREIAEFMFSKGDGEAKW